MADYNIPIITGTALSTGDLLRWSGSAWVNYAGSKYDTEHHTGRKERFAGNNGLGQSCPAYVGYGQEATVAGTRTSDTVFTRTAGTWVVDALIGQYAFSYVTDPADGVWLEITDNTTTTITVDGVLYAAADGIITSIWQPIQNEFAHGEGVTAFRGAIFDGESIWLVPFSSSNLVKVNPSDGSMTKYAHGEGGTAFQGGVFDGESIWLVPYVSNDVVKVDPSDGSMTKYAHGEAGTFAGAVFDGEFIWLVPHSNANVVKVDPSDGSMATYAHGEGTFQGGCFDGEYIWLAPRSSTKLVRLDPSDGSMVKYVHGQGANVFIGAIFDGESVWLIPHSSANLVKVDPLDGSMTTYAHGQEALAFFGGCFDGESIWLVPNNSDNLVKVNPADGSMTLYAHGKGTTAFQGGMFDGESVWLIPHSSDDLVSFIPPRLGRPSLHTTGPINAGQAKLGGADNRTLFSADGVQTMAGKARIERHFNIGAASFFKHDDPPEEDVVGIVPVLRFADNGIEQAYYSNVVPFRIEAGSTIEGEIDWCYGIAPDATSSDTGKVSWKLDFLNLATGEVVATGAATIAALSAVGTGLQTKRITTTISTGITGSVAEDVLALRLWRDTDDEDDTLAVDACFIQLHIHFIMDKLGKPTA